MSREPTEMEARVAKALSRHVMTGDFCLTLARDAIRAMREPTRDMVLISEGDGSPLGKWFAMIDAASPP